MSIAHVTLVVITGASNLVPTHSVKPLQLIWRSDTMILLTGTWLSTKLQWLDSRRVRERHHLEWLQGDMRHRNKSYVCFHWPWSVRWRGADIVYWAAGSWWRCWRHPCVNAACHPTWGGLDAWTPPGTYGHTAGYNKIRLNVWDGSKAND